MVNPFSKMLDSFRQLPDKKKYIEVVTATLLIPVLLSVIFMNYVNIQDKRNGPGSTDTNVEEPQNTSPTIITIIRDNDKDAEPTPTPGLSTTPEPTSKQQSECIKDIGPIDIVSPEENSTITGNPLEIDIRYEQGDYCSVVWSYRINESAWSDYTDNDIVVYNMGSGKKTLELRVKSLVSSQNKTMKRIFTYTNTDEVPTPTATVTPTSVL